MIFIVRINFLLVNTPMLCIGIKKVHILYSYHYNLIPNETAGRAKKGLIDSVLSGLSLLGAK